MTYIQLQSTDLKRTLVSNSFEIVTITPRFTALISFPQTTFQPLISYSLFEPMLSIELIIRHCLRTLLLKRLNKSWNSDLATKTFIFNN